MKRIAFIIFFAATNAFAQWQQTNGPYGGGVSDFASIGTTLYASSYALGNGIYATTDSGASWHESGLQGIMLNHIASNGKTLLASSNQNSISESDTIYRSSDGGATWQKVLVVGNSISRISSICPFGQNQWFVIAQGNDTDEKNLRRLHTSSDDGLSWDGARLAIDFNYYQPVILGSFKDFIFAAGTSNSNGRPLLYKSENGTNYWDTISFPQNPLRKIYSSTVSASNIWLGGIGGVVYASDGLYNWISPGDSNIVSPRLEAFISIAAASDNNLIAISSENIVYYSWDRAEHWVRFKDLPSNVFYFSVTYYGGSYFLSSSAGILRTSMQGTSWNYASSGLRCADLLALSVYNGTLFASTERGVFQSVNRGDSWIEPQTLQDLKDINITGFFDNGQSLWAFGDALYQYDPAQGNWNSVDKNPPVAFAKGASNRIFAGYDGMNPISDTSSILFTDDNAKTWQQAAFFPNSIDTEYTFVPKGMAANGSTVISVQDALVFQNFSHVYFLLRSTDNGATWSKAPAQYQPSFISYTDGAFYMGTTNGLFRSDDNGLSWHEAGFNNNVTVSSMVKIGATIIVSTMENWSMNTGLYASFDNGVSWHYQNGGTNNISGLLAADGTYLYSGGPSVWRRPLSTLDVKNPSSKPDHISLDVFPNPASDFITLRSASPLEGTLVIYDEKGSIVSKQIITLSGGDFSLPLQEYSEGIYSIRLLDKSGNEVAKARFVVMRK